MDTIGTARPRPGADPSTGGEARALVVRSGLIEAIHLATVAVVDPAGRPMARMGDVDRPFYVRSSAKPFQAAVAVRSGAGLSPEQLALACASHDGEPVHEAFVRSMLETAGLSEADLRCPPGRPLSATSDRRRIALGDTEPRRILHNCSGKHAAMLRAALSRGWSTTDYLDPSHPLQQAIVDEMRSVGALVGGPIGVDGCGAPTFPVDVLHLASAFARLATDPEYAAVRSAMHRFPALVSGVGNVDAVVATELNAVAKRGAEACLGVVVSGFGAIAIKIWDGGSRAVGPVLWATLQELGWVPHGAASRLGMSLATQVFGGGHPVGAVEGIVNLGLEP